MTDRFATAQIIRIEPSLGPSTRRALIVGLTALAVGISLEASVPTETAQALARSGPALAELLRFMAAVKAAAALATLGAILWRMGLPVTFPRFVLYAVAASTMAAGPPLIWGLVHVGLGAVLLHAGLAGCLILMWRDPAVVSRLSELVAIRRRDLGPT